MHIILKSKLRFLEQSCDQRIQHFHMLKSCTITNKAFILLPSHKINFSLLQLPDVKKLHPFLPKHISFPAALYPAHQIMYPASSLQVSFRALPLLNQQERQSAKAGRPKSLCDLFTEGSYNFGLGRSWRAVFIVIIERSP